eukprot:COSAG01_NODE_13252_length_1612_cov_1.430932_2_plen_124_part_00
MWIDWCSRTNSSGCRVTSSPHHEPRGNRKLGAHDQHGQIFAARCSLTPTCCHDGHRSQAGLSRCCIVAESTTAKLHQEGESDQLDLRDQMITLEQTVDKAIKEQTSEIRVIKTMLQRLEKKIN